MAMEAAPIRYRHRAIAAMNLETEMDNERIKEIRDKQKR